MQGQVTKADDQSLQVFLKVKELLINPKVNKKVCPSSLTNFNG